MRAMKNMTDEYELRVRQVALAQCRSAGRDDRRADDPSEKDERKELAAA